jgi:hypothetical protein
MDEQLAQAIPLSAVPVLPSAVPEPVAFANGAFLVVRKGASLADRCVKCNGPAQGVTISRGFFWTDAGLGPAGGRLRFVPLLRIGFAFVSMFRWISALRTLRSAEVRLGVCPRHRRLARMYLLVGLLALPSALAIAVISHNAYFWIWSTVTGVTIAGLAVNASRLVHPVHVGLTHVTLKGVCQAYLLSLNQKGTPRKSETPAVDQLLDSISTLKQRMHDEKSRT